MASATDITYPLDVTLTPKQFANKIWNKLVELQVVDTDGLDPREEKSIFEIEKIINEVIDQERNDLDLEWDLDRNG